MKLFALLFTAALLLSGVAVASAQSVSTDARTTLEVRKFYNDRFQKCLDADINTGNFDGGIVQLWTCGPWNQQDWEVWPDGHLYNKRFQKCLDADINTGHLDGGIVQLWTCGPWNQQWWEIWPDGHVYNKRFQKCLDADINTGNSDGGRVQLWTCGPWNQQWWWR